jgi:hypothetical protein
VAVARADPPEAKPYGVRVYSVTDPGVHAWSFWQHLRDEVELPEGWKPPPEPLSRRWLHDRLVRGS